MRSWRKAGGTGRWRAVPLLLFCACAIPPWPLVLSAPAARPTFRQGLASSHRRLLQVRPWGLPWSLLQLTLLSLFFC